MDSSSPRHGEKASYYSTVCLETDEVEWMELEGNSNGESSEAFVEQLRERHGGRLNVIWDNAPAHRGPAMRSYLETPGLNLRLPDPPAIKGREARSEPQARFPTPGKCTSHLRFGLVLQRSFLNLVSFWPEIASQKARPQSC